MHPPLQGQILTWIFAKLQIFVRPVQDSRGGDEFQDSLDSSIQDSTKVLKISWKIMVKTIINLHIEWFRGLTHFQFVIDLTLDATS